MGTSNITASLSGVTSPVDVLTVTAADAAIDRSDAGQSDDRERVDAAIHGDGDVQRHLDGERDGAGDLELVEYSHGDHYGGGVGDGRIGGYDNITASLSGVTSPVDVLTVTAATLQSIA